MPVPESTTIVRGKQTGYAKMAYTIDPFEWLGKCSRFSGLTESLGDVEITQCQDPANSGHFIPDVELESSGTELTGQVIMKKSVRNRIATQMKVCRWHLDVRYQVDERRDDPLNWTGIDRICRAKFTEYSTDDEVAFSDADQGEVLITAPFKAAPPLYHLWRVASESIDSELAGNILCVATCQGDVCPNLTEPLEECKIVFGTAAIAGNPYFGLSVDDGKTWTTQIFDGTNNTPTWTSSITGIACLGDLIIAVSNGDAAHAVSSDGGTTWREIALADYATHAPWDVYIYSPFAIWIAGNDGYIWKSTTSGRTASTDDGDAGVATDEDLRRVKGYDDNFVMAVGTNNAIVQTENGEIWDAVTGDATQDAENAVSLAINTKAIWVILYDDGELWWTDDNGATYAVDTQLDDLALAELNDCVIVACDRYVVVGADSDGNGVIYENVHGSPDYWEEISCPADVLALNQVTACDPNLFVAVGDTTYVGGNGAIVRMA